MYKHVNIHIFIHVCLLTFFADREKKRVKREKGGGQKEREIEHALLCQRETGRKRKRVREREKERDRECGREEERGGEKGRSE